MSGKADTKQTAKQNVDHICIVFKTPSVFLFPDKVEVLSCTNDGVISSSVISYTECR